jgi:hypothetical protein
MVTVPMTVNTKLAGAANLRRSALLLAGQPQSD